MGPLLVLVFLSEQHAAPMPPMGLWYQLPNPTSTCIHSLNS
jgi:hypothetical protein